jgi:DNA-directed RNA polymerase specialized sigma24 family protein
MIIEQEVSRGTPTGRAMPAVAPLTGEERKLIRHVLRYPLLEGPRATMLGGAAARQRSAARLQIANILARLSPEIAEAWRYGFSHGLSEERIAEMLGIFLEELPECSAMLQGEQA